MNLCAIVSKQYWIAGLLFAGFTSAAHAEGAPGSLDGLGYLLLSILVVLGQAIYMLCIFGVNFARKVGWLLCLGVTDFMLFMLMDTLDVPGNIFLPYLLFTLPGFFLPWYFKKYHRDK